MDVSTDAIINALIGGGLIGLAASLLLLFSGRIFGVSGIVFGAIRPSRGDLAWRIASIVGFLSAGVALKLFYPEALESEMAVSPLVAGIAGLIVGVGTNRGSGCTSGHGICGISRGSWRSVSATVTFITAGVITVAVTRLIRGEF